MILGILSFVSKNWQTLPIKNCLLFINHAIIMAQNVISNLTIDTVTHLWCTESKFLPYRYFSQSSSYIIHTVYWKVFHTPFLHLLDDENCVRQVLFISTQPFLALPDNEKISWLQVLKKIQKRDPFRHLPYWFSTFKNVCRLCVKIFLYFG